MRLVIDESGRLLAIISITLATLMAGCSESEVKSCVVTCAADADCTNGQTCGALGLCTAGEACGCTAGEFLGCDGNTARFCNDAANGIADESCGTLGCNEEAGRCNSCVAGTATCSADLTTLDHCGDDGVVAQVESCAAGCVPGVASDRCGHIKPAWLPDVCNDPASGDVTFDGATLDTAVDTSCTGGVVVHQGQTFCVVRAASIEIGNLKVTGPRPIALVADRVVSVSGTLDVSADGRTPGPGAGSLGAGGGSRSYAGGGGAGFAQLGGNGGGNEASNIGGSQGGAITDRPPSARFEGGSTTNNIRCAIVNGMVLSTCSSQVGPMSQDTFYGGGGGGGALLIACRGTVKVTGTIDAGGGGGEGGGDHYTDANSVRYGGAPGGGSGGFVALQGAQIEITGRLFANGGGGGAGCSTDNCRGLPGSDGIRSTAGAPGGDPLGNAMGGGIGGSVSNAPGAGERAVGDLSAGGGGGSMGRFQLFTPEGTTPNVSPSAASPSPEPALTVPVE